jgi:inosose dehydratase
MAVEIGNSPESWGVLGPSDPEQTPWRRCLDEIAEAGFQWTELGPYGYLPTDPSTLLAELEARGLNLAATGVLSRLDDPAAWPDLQENILKNGELAAAVGARYLNLIDGIFTIGAPGADPRSRLDESGWKWLIETTHRAAELARDRLGMRLAFHPCADTHVQFEDQIERLLEDTDPDLVSLCLDTGHHAYRGGDPVDFMRRHHDRIPYLHIKSVDAEVRNRVEAENLTMADAVKMGVMCEPSLGTVDFEGFAEVLRDVDYDGIAMVEQDQYRPPLDGLLPLARRTRQYFREVGVA